MSCFYADWTCYKSWTCNAFDNGVYGSAQFYEMNDAWNKRPLL